MGTVRADNHGPGDCRAQGAGSVVSVSVSGRSTGGAAVIRACRRRVPYGYQPAGYYDPIQGAAPQQLEPSPAAPMDGPMMTGDEIRASPGATRAAAMAANSAWAAATTSTSHCCDGCFPTVPADAVLQRWYDASAEWVSLERDEIGESTVFATDGVAGAPVLGTDQLDFGEPVGSAREPRHPTRCRQQPRVHVARWLQLGVRVRRSGATPTSCSRS